MSQRADVQKVETKGVLANKPLMDHQQTPDSEFTNDAPYSEVRRIMLQCKFQDFAEQRDEADEKEVERMKKVHERWSKD